MFLPLFLAFPFWGCASYASLGSVFDFAGAFGTLDSHGDALPYFGFDDSSVKGEKEASVLGKVDFSRASHEVVLLITSFFPHAKPSSSPSSLESYPWMDVFGTANRCDPRIFLSLIDKLSSVSKEVSEKFRKAVGNRRKASTALPHGAKHIIWETLAIFIRPLRSVRVFLGFWTSPFRPLVALPYP